MVNTEDVQKMLLHLRSQSLVYPQTVGAAKIHGEQLQIAFLLMEKASIDGIVHMVIAMQWLDPEVAQMVTQRFVT